MYILVLLACFEADPPLITSNYIGVIMPKVHLYEDFDKACTKIVMNSLKVIFYLAAEAFATV